MSIVQACIVDCSAACNSPGKGLYGASRDIVEGLLISHCAARCMNGYQQLTGLIAFSLECFFGHFRIHPSKSPDFGYFLEKPRPDAYEFIREEGKIVEIKAPLVDQQSEKLFEHCYFYGKSLRVVTAGLLKMLAENTGAHMHLISYDVFRGIQPKLDDEIQRQMIGLSEGVTERDIPSHCRALPFNQSHAFRQERQYRPILSQDIAEEPSKVIDCPVKGMPSISSSNSSSDAPCHPKTPASLLPTG